MLRFVLLSTQRSGSTFLRIWLNSHSQISSHGEVFLANYPSPDGFRKYCLNASLLSTVMFFVHNTRLFKGVGINLITHRMIDDYLDKLYHDPSHSAPWTDFERRDEFVPKRSVLATGYKLMYGTLEHLAALQRWIDDQPGLMFIHLIRDNLLKSYISEERMRLSSVAHTTDESFVYSPVHIDMRKLINYFDTKTSKRQFYRQKFSTGHPYLELSYEDMFADQARTIQTILDFFSLRPEQMPLPQMKKISSGELKSEVTNHREVFDGLTGTAYEAFLSDFDY